MLINCLCRFLHVRVFQPTGFEGCCLSARPLGCLFIHPSVCSSVHLSVHSICLSVHLFAQDLSLCLIHLSIYPDISLFIHLSVCLSIDPSVCSSVCLSVSSSCWLRSVCYPSIYPSSMDPFVGSLVWLSVCLSACLSVCLSLHFYVMAVCTC